MSPLSVRTVHISVPHTNIKGTDSLPPIFIKERIVALECAGDLRVIAGLTVLDINNFHIRGDNVHHLIAIQPTEAFIFLSTVSGDIFPPQTLCFGQGYLVVVGLHFDCAAGWRLDFQIWRDLGIVRQRANQCVTGATHFWIVHQACTFPHWNRPFDQLPEWWFSHNDREFHRPAKTRRGRATPIGDVFSCVKAKIALRKPIVGLRLPGSPISLIDSGIPSLVRQYLKSWSLRLKKQPGHPTVGVAETITAEMPN